MGVQGLWELLAPVGRRVSVETLAGKRLAIDASIWMVQFMKAMRDERGEMVRNAHLVGFFRRICKLLFLRTKPVFVFDGGTPALKRRTVTARRRHRDNAQAKIRKTAEKLLLNHLRARKLEELANEMKIRKEKDTLKGKEVLKCHDGSSDNNREGNEENMKTYNRESLDEMLAASLAAEENLNSSGNASTSTGFNPPEEEEDGDENEEMVLPVMHGKVDPTILAALPPSLQLDLLVQMREQRMAENRKKYQKVKKTPTKFSELQIQSYLKTVAFRREIDEVQKSAAGRGVAGMQASRIASEPNREFIFSSSFTGDKRMLSSTGVDKNGSVPQTLGKEPVRSVSVGSVSSSEVHSVGTNAVDEPSRDETTGGFNFDVETYVDERGRVRVSRVRGLGIRMTRDLQRNLDLMKELEMEKQKEDVSKYMEAISDAITLGASKVAQGSKQYLESSTGDKASKQIVNLSGMMDGISTQIGEDLLSCDQPAYAGKDSMEISFFGDEAEANNTEVDDLFAQLVTGNSNFSTESVPCGKHTSEISGNDSLAEVAPKGSFSSNVEKSQPSLADNSICDEGEVDWEEGTCEVPMDTSHSTCEHKQTVSRGHLEEEADIQEAMRRSLEDITKENSILLSSLGEYVEHSGDMLHPPDVLLENSVGQCQVSYEAVEGDDLFEMSENEGVNTQAMDSLEKEIIYSRNSDVNTDGKSALMEGNDEQNPESDTVVSSHSVCIDRKSALMEGERNTEGNTVVSSHNVCTDGKFSVGKAPSDASSKESMQSSITGLGYLNNNHNRGRISGSSDECAVGSSGIISQALNAARSDSIDVIAEATNQDGSEASHSCHSSEKGNKRPEILVGTFAEKIGTENDREQTSLMGNVGSILIDDGEHKRDDANQSSEFQPYVSEITLDEEMLLLQQERMDLGDEQRKLERNAESVSSEMFAECQELLQMFGLPYIIAPMEAEAQCAYMELMNLVDGVVTDDSDVFLFGARSVYKNIFDDRKYVETYFMKDIESELGLTREKLIHMALLLGSDYTEGVSGIGIVNAIEVVHAFPEEDGLQKFREWVESPDPAIFGKLDAYMGNSSRKKVSKARTVDADDSTENVNVSVINEDDICDRQQSSDNISKTKQMFMDKHRNVSKNWHIPSSFPSDLVTRAYTSPQVDKSTEPFSWGKPDQFMLRKLCWERFGWANQKADELLVPVLKEYNKHETQLRLEAFYTFNERFAKIRSQRIKKAVKGITGNRASELMDDLPQQGANSGKKRRVSCLQTEQGISSYGMKNTAAENDKNDSRDTVAKKPQKQKTVNPLKHSAAGTMAGKVDRGKGKGHVMGGGRTRRKQAAPNFKSTEASSSDIDDNTGKNMHVNAAEDSFKLRRSARPRKQVVYAPKDLEIDLSESSSPSDTDSSGGNSRDRGPASGKKSLDQVPVSNQGTVEDATGNVSSLDESLTENCGDFIQSGGGFCSDNDGDQTRDESPGLEHPVSDNVSREYLVSGGGFCLDDGADQNEQAIQNSPSSPRAVDELLPGEKVVSCKATQCSNAKDFSGFDCLTNINELSSRNPHEADTDDGNRNSPSQLAQQTDILTEEPAPGTAFSAMPSLRRKRRRT